MSNIEYEIRIKNGKIAINMSKKALVELFNGSYDEFCKEIDKIAEDTKNIYFRGRKMKKQDNFYREEDKWDYIGYSVVILTLGLFIFIAMI